MNLPELQRILARIVTDPDLRERFLDDPEGVADCRGWDTDLARVLATIPPPRLRHYGEGLVHKRGREAAGCLPLTFKVLGGSRFHALYRDYARSSTPRGPARRGDDAVAFADTLRRGRLDAPRHPTWLADLAGYEAASLRARSPSRRIVLVRLGYSPRDLVEAALSGGSAGAVPRRSSLVVWVRLPWMHRARPIRLAIPRS